MFKSVSDAIRYCNRNGYKVIGRNDSKVVALDKENNEEITINVLDKNNKRKACNKRMLFEEENN